MKHGINKHQSCLNCSKFVAHYAWRSRYTPSITAEATLDKNTLVSTDPKNGGPLWATLSSPLLTLFEKNLPKVLHHPASRPVSKRALHILLLKLQNARGEVKIFGHYPFNTSLYSLTIAAFSIRTILKNFLAKTMKSLYLLDRLD